MSSRTPDADQLIAQFASGRDLPPCTVLSGDEILLITEAADAYRAAATRLGCSERTHLVLDARSDWSTALMAARNTSLFGDLRMVEVSLPTGKPGKTGADTLQTLADMAAQGQLPDVRILIRLPALDWTTQKAKWVQALKKQATWIDVPTIPRASLPQWIAGRLARQDHTADADTLAWLSDKVEGNLLAAHQEIQKLALLHPAGTLTLDQVQAAVLNVARYNLYDLRDAMLAGQADRALTVLSGLRAEGEALPLVLWAVGEEIRILTRVSADANPDGALRAYRIFGPRERLVRQALQRVPARAWPPALRHAHEVDRLIKGIPVPGRLQDPWDELARLVLRVASAGTRRP
ncbi:DNA polymerase III subunit delta [Castellaniella sp.]|uniref:DNA polymerase III subunit delta n=1 Tax=Castellaniella sp. TaxID=1955812 RepID=UPI002AFF3C11|nr:DNA polymerase III subunit delta [Castellaniella sp.]